MKFKYFFSLLLLAGLTSCSTDSEEVIPDNELEGLVKIQTIQNHTHKLELYSANGDLQEGYNKIVFNLQTLDGREMISDAEIQWNPMMHMESMAHSAPKSEINKRTENLYEGYIIFTMAENEIEYWSIDFDYTIDGEVFSLEAPITVLPTERQKVTSFMGLDDKRYVLTLVEPTDPEVATNEVTIGLFQMANMMEYPVMDGYRILIDPRMPGMGNHSSPNNVHLTRFASDDFYHGKLNLTMSGYWRINLILHNEHGEVVKGEPVDEINESSSLYVELEF
ncbi:hypothetical protein GCM10007103_19230 [Salinimicrobium marinum]|uniref:YtkA-like n=1 Tax=Salinimicrobium marinum TaxID=680283 RepID=A0A918SF80_9FLAO|nr:hypothetical protein [Salinimicrobium marinum]GHA37835.1 hypothetical protein GCM10007103_19230 [Salinimicrobium marinum]